LQAAGSRNVDSEIDCPARIAERREFFSVFEREWTEGILQFAEKVKNRCAMEWHSRGGMEKNAHFSSIWDLLWIPHFVRNDI
jgi:hypothetical protein